MKKKVIVFLLSLMAAVGYVNTQNPKVVVSDKTGWHKIGSTNVDLQKEREEVAVLITDRFSALKFRVEKEPIDLTNVEVYYEDGTSQTLKINGHIKAAGESEKFDLAGVEKSIKKVVFLYK